MPKATARRSTKGAKGKSKSVEQTVRAGVRKALPMPVREMSDILEKRPSRMTNRAKREMQCQIGGHSEIPFSQRTAGTSLIPRCGETW
jgi:hypothetical protein